MPRFSPIAQLVLGLTFITPLAVVLFLGVTIEERIFIGWYVNDVINISIAFLVMALVGVGIVISAVWRLIQRKPAASTPDR